ncbi:MAG: response regulator transcription factor [Chloroflexi bacterium]|nr:response regulator transcription factor [Chloroflexota bacterium]
MNSAMGTGRILVIEDEPKIVDVVDLYLEREGFEVLVASDGRTGLRMFEEQRPDLVILDLMLPVMDGLEVCRAIRKESAVPIVMLTARDEEIDKILGLELGADDYVTKPFSPRELVARVKAVLRRTAPEAAAPSERIVLGDLVVDPERHEVSWRGAPVSLTPTEFRILLALARQPGRVFSRLQLLDIIQDQTYEGYERTIDAHIKNIRRKAGEDIISTVRGVGYKMEVAARAQP